MGLDDFIYQLGVVISVLLGVDLMRESKVVVLVYVDSAGLLRLVKVEVVYFVSLKRKRRNIQTLALEGLFDALLGRGIELVEDSQMGDVLMVISLIVVLLQRKLGLIQQLQISIALKILIFMLHFKHVRIVLSDVWMIFLYLLHL